MTTVKGFIQDKKTQKNLKKNVTVLLFYIWGHRVLNTFPVQGPEEKEDEIVPEVTLDVDPSPQGRPVDNRSDVCYGMPNEVRNAKRLTN